MNKHHISGKMDQATGKVKEKMGTALNNQRLANSGVADQIKGAAKEVWGNVKDATKDDARKHEQSNETRRRVTEKTQEMKNRANQKIHEFRKSA
jgi:uncharacterized protein YjbJ (UPF0337 family)